MAKRNTATIGGSRISDYTCDSFAGLNTSVKDVKTLPKGVSPDSLNWITGTEGDHIELRRGMAVLGVTKVAGSGKVTGLGIGVKFDGTQVPYFSYGRKIKYYDVVTDDTYEAGSSVLPLLASGDDMSFVPFQNLAGSFIMVSSQNSSIYKIHMGSPSSVVDQLSTSFRGKIFSGHGNIYLGDNKSATGFADPNGVNISSQYFDSITKYTGITGEAVGALGSTHYTGTLAFKAAGAKRTCFQIQIIEATGETLIDNGNGVLTGTLGSTGTINYATGAYDVTFNHTTAGAVTASYYWDDMTVSGNVLDFSLTGGNSNARYFPQYDAGGNFEAVFPFNNIDYSFHKLKVWAITLGASASYDSNLIYRSNLGIPFFRSAYPTGDGILILDNSNPSEPKVRVLEIAPQTNATTIVPTSISDVLDLSKNYFDYAVLYRWGDYDILACQKSTSSVKDTYNGVMFIRNINTKFWDKLDYNASCLADFNGGLIGGDSISNNLFQLFSGFDDDGSEIANYYNTKNTDLDVPGLKRANRMIVDGLIQPDQSIDVSIAYDGGNFVNVFTIDGRGAYVDTGRSTTVGSYTIGSKVLGGGGLVSANPFLVDFPINSDLFEYMQIKFEAKAIGFVQINKYTIQDIRWKGRRCLPTQMI